MLAATDKSELRFGGLVSTSNVYLPGAKAVSVHTDEPLVWTTEYSQAKLEGALRD